MTSIRLQLLLVLLISFVLSVQGDDCIATIRNGTVIGSRADTLDPLKKVCSFTGIPYVSPPLGSLRFKPPQPASAWGSMNATELPNWCPQFGVAPPGHAIGEDCLYLNIYRPEVEDISNASLPVMIWFHGGGFTNGDTMHFYKPTRLLARGDVVLVVVHYRLGLLGFLSTGDDVSPGNNGLKDQAFSIRWVHENIKAFGGNPDQVTIFGQSAGGVSVSLQIVSPLNKGLLHGAIIQSGTALEFMDSNPLESAKLMANRLGCPTTSSSVIVDCLSNVSWEEIVLEQTKHAAECTLNMSLPFATTSPVVEPNLPGAFLTEEPWEILKNGDVDNIPVMLGTTKHDGGPALAGLYLGRLAPLKLDQNPEYMRNGIIPDILKYFEVKGDEANRGLASTIEMAYLSGVNRSSWNESMPGLVDLMTVFSFKASAQHTVDLLSKRGMEVYLFNFDHHSQNSLWSFYFGAIDMPIEHGVTHGDDMIYLFDTPASFSPEDQLFSEKIIDMWINFARFGNPTPSPSDRYDQWPTYNTSTESFMKLNVTPTAMSGYRSTWRPNGFEWN